MKIKLLLLLGLLAGGLMAQKANMGIHVSAVYDTEENNYLSNPTFGGGLSYHFYINQNFSLGVEAFYQGFRYDGQDSVINILPLQGVAAVHFPLSENFEVYAGTGGGVFIERYKNRFSLAANELLWGLTPRAGLVYEFAENVSLDVHFQYMVNLSDTPGNDDVTGILTFNTGLAYNIFAEL